MVVMAYWKSICWLGDLVKNTTDIPNVHSLSIGGPEDELQEIMEDILP